MKYKVGDKFYKFYEDKDIEIKIINNTYEVKYFHTGLKSIFSEESLVGLGYKFKNDLAKKVKRCLDL
jgi:hypothetical protein